MVILFEPADKICEILILPLSEKNVVYALCSETGNMEEIEFSGRKLIVTWREKEKERVNNRLEPVNIKKVF